MANEAGAGAVDRASVLTNTTMCSDVVASVSGDCTRLAVYSSSMSEGDTIKFAFLTAQNPIALGSSVYTFTVTAGEAGAGKFERTSAGGDFTAFAVTSGWYLAAYVQGQQDYASTGGIGFFYGSGDRLFNGAGMSDAGSPYIDSMEADIDTGGGGSAIVTLVIQQEG